MRCNLLGNSGLFVSELALGTMTFGASGPLEAMGGGRAVRRRHNSPPRLDAGVNLIGTADAYSNGSAERILGRAFKNLGLQRERVIADTKAFSRADPLDAATASLTRLGTDYFDLCRLRGFDADRTAGNAGWIFDSWGKGRRERLAARRSVGAA